jgi:hypothetical protein
MIDGKEMHLGLFSSIEDAAAAYQNVGLERSLIPPPTRLDGFRRVGALRAAQSALNKKKAPVTADALEMRSVQRRPRRHFVQVSIAGRADFRERGGPAFSLTAHATTARHRLFSTARQMALGGLACALSSAGGVIA